MLLSGDLQGCEAAPQESMVKNNKDREPVIMHGYNKWVSLTLMPIL